MTEEKRRPLILVADDVPKNLQLLGSILRQEVETEIAFASNGIQVLEFVEEALPDLILLDVMMPEMDGFETCRRLKMKDETRNIPVIFLTARVDKEDIVKGFSLGAVDYVTKPFESVELVARVKTHLSIKQMRDDLLDLNRTKDKFFSIISHDLKNPMGAILTLAELLNTRFGTYSEERKEILITTLYDSARAAYALLENLLIWSRAQGGKIDFEPSVFEIRPVVESVIQLLRQGAEKKNIRIDNQIGNGQMVFADRNMLETVIRNLISNGIKFTSDDGGITIGSSLENEGGKQMAVISVSDTGLGIPASRLDTLFRIGHAYSTPGTQEESGTGLGLILCSEFVKLNGGRISVSSEEGEGSTFSFSVPQG
ncbi:MAG: hybrid sensor histidine kinase/response regulator [Bacteroidota bacterium]